MKTQATKANHSYTATIESINTGYYSTDAELLKKIERGDTDALDKFYMKHRAEFMQWAYKYFGLTADQSLDIYHDTIVIFYENIRKGKLQHLQSSLKTYVFGISKNLIFQQNSKDRKIREKWDYIREETEIEDDPVDEQFMIQEAIAKCMRNLTTSSQNLLKAYYYEKLPMRTIAEKLGYKNEHVAKNMKLRCMKELKKAVLQAIKDN